MAWYSDLLISGTVHNFIGFALAVAWVMTIYYFVKMVSFESDEEKQRKKDAGDEARDAFDKFKTEQIKKQKEKKKHDTRQKYMYVVRDRILNAISKAKELYSETLNQKKNSEVRRAKELIHQIERYLHQARRNVRYAHRQIDDGLAQSLRDVHASCSAISKHLKREVNSNLPKNEHDPDWDAKVSKVYVEAKQVSTWLGALVNNIEDYIGDADKTKIEIDNDIKEMRDKLEGETARTAAADKERKQKERRELVSNSLGPMDKAGLVRVVHDLHHSYFKQVRELQDRLEAAAKESDGDKRYNLNGSLRESAVSDFADIKGKKADLMGQVKGSSMEAEILSLHEQLLNLEANTKRAKQQAEFAAIRKKVTDIAIKIRDELQKILDASADGKGIRFSAATVKHFVKPNL